MTVTRLTVLLAGTLMLGACSVRDCGSDADYLSASMAGRMVVPEGVNLAPANPLYYIPTGGDGELVLSREYLDDEGETRIACLYEPPRLELAEVGAEEDAAE